MTIPCGYVTETERERERQTETEIQTERERETDAQIDYHKGFRALGGSPPKGLGRTAALGLWEGLSHSALLRSIVII